MATALRPIGHEDRLSLVEHLGELRTRLVICAIALTISCLICFWQNSALLGLLNAPLEETLKSGTTSTGQLSESAQSLRDVRGGLKAAADGFGIIARSGQGFSPAERKALRDRAAAATRAADALPKVTPPRKPITTGVGEPFTATLSVVLAFGVLFALPLILYQAYAFILPAFSPVERRVATPMMLLVPVLFTAGVVFAYFAVLPPAIRFLQGFNSDSFDILIHARDYYRFEIFTLLALGLVFQIPVGMLAANRVGLVDAGKLIRGWRYAIVACVVIAAALPGVDPVTTALESIPLFLLYGLSILLLKVYDRSPPEEPDDREEALIGYADDEDPADLDPDRADDSRDP